MIHKETFSLEWIKKVSAKSRIADKTIIEKVCRAFSLLEGLSETGLDFVFKGGTALMLLTGSQKRLSIGIDIVMPEHCDLLERLNEAAENKGFIKTEYQIRKQVSIIDKEHYRFFYKPVYKTSLDMDYVLLDILYETPGYQQIKKINIDSPFIKTIGKKSFVNVPGYEDLLGDKMTAFAPDTTGIPYQKGGKSASLEICKQLFDIGTLFDLSEDIEIIRKTYLHFSALELHYRKLNLNVKDVLDDTYQTALCLTTRGQDGKGDFTTLSEGISKVRSFIFSEPYHIERAINDAAKAAYLSQLILADSLKIEKYKGNEQVNSLIIEQPFNTKLNKLKKTHPQAFFYWYHTCQLRNLRNQV